MIRGYISTLFKITTQPWPMAAATGAVEITLPVAIVAAAYIIGQSKAGQGGVPIPIRTVSPFGANCLDVCGSK